MLQINRFIFEYPVIQINQSVIQTNQSVIQINHMPKFSVVFTFSLYLIEYRE